MHPFYRSSPLFNCQTSKQKARWKRWISNLLSKEGIQDSAQTLGKQIFTKLKTDDRQCLLSSLMHRTKGSPIKPTEQVHIGLWFTTWQLALRPHVAGHGSKHFWSIHAFSWGHSVLTIHSGLHAGGEPTCPAWHEQTGCSFATWHTL